MYPSSFCPHCKASITWYDLIPVVSWILLKGKCRTCKLSISFIYPLIEIVTSILFTLTFFTIPIKYWVSYFIFFTALIIIIRTDLEFMLISRITTLYLIPFAFIFSVLNLIDISIYQSILGTFFGYFILWSISKIYFLLRGTIGIGQGDFELLGTIGGFIGISGAWYSLFIGSLIGSLFGIFLILTGSSSKAKIPFGPCLSFGAILFSLLKFFILNK